MMFEPSDTPRVFAVPIGVDFGAAVVEGLLDRAKDQSPEALARIEIFTNTQRMARRLDDLLRAGDARFLPRIRLIPDLARHPALPIALPEPVNPLRRRLMLAQLIRAAQSKLPQVWQGQNPLDLARSLTALMDEMQGDGVPLARLAELDTGQQSDHWGHILEFLSILADHWDSSQPRDPMDRLRAAVAGFADHWVQSPPDHPILVVGSTGSRRPTRAFMQTVAGLPQGAVVLPGLDRDLDDRNWRDLKASPIKDDHAQATLLSLCNALNVNPVDVPDWTPRTPPVPARNKVISLALRPAPFTHQWRREGPDLVPHLQSALQDVTLIEAPSQRDEANALALCLRKAVHEGKRAVLITPDRTLGRRVTTCLQRWQILPDDSAGRPLHLTPPGVFLRLVADLFAQPLTPLMLIRILKHPIAAASTTDGSALRRARELERDVLRGGAPFVDFKAIAAWGMTTGQDSWVSWLSAALADLDKAPEAPLETWAQRTMDLAQRLAAGPDGTPDALWDLETGGAARAAIDRLLAETDASGPLSARDYRIILYQELSSADVRIPERTHPGVSIWGTLEARVQGADLVLLGGLTEGIWPSQPNPDPWMNRSMRAQLGLTPPERLIGLSAHDFQQAVAAPQVILSRALRDGDAPTVASRWLIRLTNLLGGLGEPGEEALQTLRAKGQTWLDLAAVLDAPEHDTPRATRPAPQPPVAARPSQLSVTRIQTLIRDPYAIYARFVLGLKKLDALGREPDALARGIALHEVIERFVDETRDALPQDARRAFELTAAQVLAETTPWPTTRAVWQARLSRIADWFVRTERLRRATADVVLSEETGTRTDVATGFKLTAKADRIDRRAGGGLVIYDYKSGDPPSEKQMAHFDKQLMLEAAIAQAGGFAGLDPDLVEDVAYIGLKDKGNSGEGVLRHHPLEPGAVDQVWSEFASLIQAFSHPDQGYLSRARVVQDGLTYDYDHLARHGEWSDSDDGVAERLE